jgi:Zn-dependent peptidase ImmA (M78 family)
MKKLKTREILYEIGKIFGVSPQTIYRSVSAIKSIKSGQTPKKYASRTYNNLKNNIKSR